MFIRTPRLLISKIFILQFLASRCPFCISVVTFFVFFMCFCINEIQLFENKKKFLNPSPPVNGLPPVSISEIFQTLLPSTIRTPSRLFGTWEYWLGEIKSTWKAFSQLGTSFTKNNSHWFSFSKLLDRQKFCIVCMYACIFLFIVGVINRAL